jgi:ankyrin repeat protein
MRRPVTGPAKALRAAQDGYTPLILAAGRGNTAMVRELISFQADVNLRSRVRASLRPRAHRLVIVVRSRGVRPQGDDDWTPLFFCAIGGHASAVRLLLAAAADPNAVDKVTWTRARPSGQGLECASQDGATALMMCCSAGA